MLFRNGSDTNRSVHAQNMARDWKILDLESKGIVLSVWRKQRRDQLLVLCFRICRLFVFSRGGSVKMFKFIKHHSSLNSV